MSAFNQDELEPPKWLDRAFIFEILKNCEDDKPSEIIDVKFSPGSGRNDHYASIMFRVGVTFRTAKGKSSRSMIIKTHPDIDSSKGELLNNVDIFETEIKMYSETIPKMEAELRKYEDNTKLGAKTLYHSLSPKKIIVFEDLCENGYTTLPKPMTIEEARMMLLMLSKWHAVSYKLASQNDAAITSYSHGICNNPTCVDSPFFCNGVQSFVDYVSNTKDLKKYAAKFKALQSRILPNCVNVFNAHKNGDKQSILVLNHGDFHIKNAMFKYTGGKLEHIQLVDFQFCTYAPAVIDVMYSIYMVLNADLRRNRRDELIYYYFDNFRETLRKIEYQGTIPSLADFHIDLIRHRDFEVFLVMIFLPFWMGLMESEENFEIGQLVESSEQFNKVYRQPKLLEAVKSLLPGFLYRGYLDS